jgi:hypothetical protein
MLLSHVSLVPVSLVHSLDGMSETSFDQLNDIEVPRLPSVVMEDVVKDHPSLFYRDDMIVIQVRL